MDDIDIDITRGILGNIDSDKILYQQEFGISNTPTLDPYTLKGSSWIVDPETDFSPKSVKL